MDFLVENGFPSFKKICSHCEPGFLATSHIFSCILQMSNMITYIYIQILYESHVFIFVSFQAFNSQVGKPLHAFQDIVYMWKVFVWNRATYKMCQRCPTIRPIVDQQSVRWNNFLNSLIVLMVTLQAFLLDLYIVRMKSKLTAPRCHRSTHPHIWRPFTKVDTCTYKTQSEFRIAFVPGLRIRDC